MPLIDESDEYRRYSYQCTELNILFDDGNRSQMMKLNPIRLVNFSITSNYVRDLFPVIHIQMILEPSVYYRIIQNKNKSKIQIRLDKF